MNTNQSNSVQLSNKDYLAARSPEWRYPLLDGEPPKGKKLNLLTSGGIAVVGQWNTNSNYLAWAPLIKSSKIKEHMTKLLMGFKGLEVHKEELIKFMRAHAQYDYESEVLMDQRHLYTALTEIMQDAVPFGFARLSFSLLHQARIISAEHEILLSIFENSLRARIKLPCATLDVTLTTSMGDIATLTNLIDTVYRCEDLVDARSDTCVPIKISNGTLFKDDQEVTAYANERSRLVFEILPER